jgi:hypothetical protein
MAANGRFPSYTHTHTQKRECVCVCWERGGNRERESEITKSQYYLATVVKYKYALYYSANYNANYWKRHRTFKQKDVCSSSE